MLPSWGPALLSDTVGFIRDLPHSLIASFKATLEEARQADLLLHIADADNPAVLDQITAVFQVLREIGIDEKDLLLVVNKVDLPRAAENLPGILNRYPNAIIVSAKTGEGFDRLASAVSDALSHSFRDVDIETAIDNGRLMAFIAAHGEILSRRYNCERVIIHCRIPSMHLGRIHEAGTIIHEHNASESQSFPVVDPAANPPLDSSMVP